MTDEERTPPANDDDGSDDDNAKYLRDELYARIRDEPELFDWLQQSSIDGLFYWDLENVANEWMSAEFKALFGYGDDEIPNKSTWWQENIFAEDKEAALVAFQAHVGPERLPYDQLVRYRHKNGETIHVRCRGQASFDATGKPVRMLGAHNDVTDLMRAKESVESDLRMKDAALDVLRKTALDGYFDWDMQTGEEVLSDRWKRLLGYEPDEIQDLHAVWKSLLHPDDVAKAEAALDQHLNHEAPYNVVLRFTRKDGGCSYMRSQGVAQRDPETNDWVRMFGTFTDVTDLEEAREAAKAANRAKSTFLATMSHEIRTPLNAVLGMAQSLFGTSLTAEQLDDLTTLRNAGTHLLSLLNDLLDFSQIEAGHLTIANDQFNIEETCTSVLDVTLGQATKKGIALTIDSTVPAGSTFLGDSDRIRQIVFNLVGNAIKFTAEGSVDLTLEPESRDSRSGVSIHVKDSGVGMSPEAQTIVFQDFVQATSETRKTYGGSGLGLNICLKLVNAMGGFISVKSELDVGSVFSVWIPGLQLPVSPKTLDDFPVSIFETGGDTLLSRCVGQILTCPVQKYDLIGTLLSDLATQKCPRTVLVNRRSAQDDEILVALSEVEDARFIVLGRGPYAALSRFNASSLVVLPTFPTKDELFHALSSEPQSQAHAPIPDTMDPTIEPLRILIAEDNVINQKVLLRLLSKLPCETTVVSNGLEAVRAASERDFELVLMDCLMPVMDGPEACRRIRETGSTVEIVALTADAHTSSRDECIAAGMTGFLTKPVNIGLLKKLIDDIILRR